MTHENLISGLRTISKVQPAPESVVPRRRRNRRSGFAPYREDILQRLNDGKSLSVILDALRFRHPTVDLPTAPSSLYRFIQKCCLLEK